MSDARLEVPIKDGSLELIVTFVSVNGSARPFIVRRLNRSRSHQSTRTEQHTLIHSANDLNEWISNDEFSAQLPEAFSRLKQLCLAGMS